MVGGGIGSDAWYVEVQGKFLQWNAGRGAVMVVVESGGGYSRAGQARGWGDGARLPCVSIRCVTSFACALGHWTGHLKTSCLEMPGSGEVGGDDQIDVATGIATGNPRRAWHLAKQILPVWGVQLCCFNANCWMEVLISGEECLLVVCACGGPSDRIIQGHQPRRATPAIFSSKDIRSREMMSIRLHTTA
jgi:hypothetical protein